MKGRDVRYNDNGDGEVDTEFWAQAAADQAAGQKNPDEEGMCPSFRTHRPAIVLTTTATTL